MKRLPVQAAAMARTFLLRVVALAGLAWPAGVAAQGVSASVLSIGDGDTIRVRQAGKALTVRLACIDAPESAQSPYGQQARRYLQQLLPIGRKVSLIVKTTDRYGRAARRSAPAGGRGWCPARAGRRRTAAAGAAAPGSGRGWAPSMASGGQGRPPDFPTFRPPPGHQPEPAPPLNQAPSERRHRP